MLLVVVSFHPIPSRRVFSLRSVAKITTPKWKTLLGRVERQEDGLTTATHVVYQRRYTMSDYHLGRSGYWTYHWSLSNPSCSTLCRVRTASNLPIRRREMLGGKSRGTG